MKVALCVLAVCLAPLGAQTTAPQANLGTPTPATLAEKPAVNPAAHTALTGAVMQRLTNDPELGSIPLTVNVTDKGVVSLNGVVAEQSQAAAAVAAAKSVPGVAEVKSDILVNQDPFAAPAGTTGASLPARTQGDGNSLLGSPSNDPVLQTAAALQADPALARVSASVYGQEVNVIGSVSSHADEARAVAIVKQHLPQYKLQNLLWVDKKPLAPPAKLPQGSGNHQ